MSVRGEASRQRIMDAARVLFAAKGFSKVTMKDICDGAGMSRGGLYRHYPSTEAIFAALIEDEQQSALRALRTAEKNGVSPPSILFTYVKNRIGTFLDRRSNIENAITEYAANSEEGMRILKTRARLCISIVTEQINKGKDLGLFTCQDSDGAARHIVWLLEGMAKHSAFLPVEADEIDKVIGEIAGIIGYQGK